MPTLSLTNLILLALLPLHFSCFFKLMGKLFWETIFILKLIFNTTMIEILSHVYGHETEFS